MIDLTKEKKMKTLKELSIEHFNRTLSEIKENDRLIRIALITSNKNELLRLRFKSTQLKSTLEYHREKVNE